MGGGRKFGGLCDVVEIFPVLLLRSMTNEQAILYLTIVQLKRLFAIGQYAVCLCGMLRESGKRNVQPNLDFSLRFTTMELVTKAVLVRINSMLLY